MLFSRKIVFLEELLKRLPLYITLKRPDYYDGKNTGYFETMYPRPVISSSSFKSIMKHNSQGNMIYRIKKIAV